MPRKPVPIVGSLNRRTEGLFRRKLEWRGECLEFMGTRNRRGHGFVDVSKKRQRFPILAHRLAWVLANGREPGEGMLVLHRCNNPPCCNPEHLYEGTRQDNVNDMIAAGRHVATLKGIKGVAHPASRYTLEQKGRAIGLIVNGRLSQRIAGWEAKIHPQTVSRWWKEWEELCAEVGREKAMQMWKVPLPIDQT
jgi:hypothetical protein